MNRKTILAVWMLALGWLGLPAPGYACSCIMPKAPCEEFWRTDALFVGTVTAIKTVKNTDGYSSRRVTLAISEALRGVTGNEVEVATGLGGGDCGYGFTRGEQYLVYAYRIKEKEEGASGLLSASICSRTRPLAEAGNDLAYVRSLGKAKTGAALFGQVVLLPHEPRADAPQNTPLAHLRVTITGTQREFTATTDEEGNYRLEGLPAGDYSVSLATPTEVATPAPVKITLPDKGCGEASFWLRLAGGRLRGKVFSQPGQTVTGVELFLRPADQRQWSDAVMVKEDGSYEFKEIPPGQYHVLFKHPGLVKGERLVAAYHPATFDVAQAAIIVIAEGQGFDDYSLHLPPFPKQRVVAGIALNAGGQPLAQVMVNYGVPNENFVATVKTDSAGRFSLQVYEGAACYARVILEPRPGKFEYYRWMPVPAAAQPFQLVAQERLQ